MGGIQGQASDIEITSREILKLKKELYTIISEHSGQPYDKVYADSDRDYWMTSQEALDYGMIDKVLEKVEKVNRKLMAKKRTMRCDFCGRSQREVDLAHPWAERVHLQ